MRKNRFLMSALVMIALLLFPHISFASGSDTLVVYASGPTLDEVINADITSSGVQAHSVYKLVSLDTTYIFLGSVLPKSSITVIGVLGSNGRPPCIQPGVLSDGSIPGTLFNLTKRGLVVTFKNLYILDMSTNGSYHHPGYDILVSGDSVKVYADNVVFDYNHGNVFGYTGNWCDFFITNCKFRNGVDPVTWTDSEILAPLWPAVPAVDSIVMKYNTIFACNAYAVVAKPPARYIEFSHNDVVFTFLQPFFIFPVFSAKISNNIFYGAFVGGETQAEYPWWDEMFSPEVPSLIDLDTMDVKSDSIFDPADANKPNWRMLAEGKRNIEVSNNIYFQPKAITDFWTAWDDTARGSDSLYTPGWMNSRTTHMFNDPTDWPGFKASGNLNVDPGYGSSLANVISGGGSYGIGLLKYFTLIRTGQSPTIGWGYQIQSIPTGSTNWIPYWPLPEETSGDLRYTAALTAPDGKPYGDPYWFVLKPTGIREQATSTPLRFDLSNNYPNPFNPSTTIKVSLSHSGVMSLKVYNVLGQLVKVVDEGYKPAGEYVYEVNMDNFGSGVYFYTLQQGNNMITKKMILMK